MAKVINKIVNIMIGAMIPICLIEIVEKYGMCYGIKESAYVTLGIIYLLSLIYESDIKRIKKYKNLQEVIKYAAIGIVTAIAITVGYIAGTISEGVFR